MPEEQPLKCLSLFDENGINILRQFKEQKDKPRYNIGLEVLAVFDKAIRAQRSSSHILGINCIYALIGHPDFEDVSYPIGKLIAYKALIDEGGHIYFKFNFSEEGRLKTFGIGSIFD